MFTPQKLEKIPVELVKLYNNLEIEIMLDIIRRLKETGKITRTADYQINRLYHQGISKKKIKKFIESILKLSKQEIDNIYNTAIKSGYLEDESLYKATGKSFIKFENNTELQQIISGIKEQTNNKLYNITQSTGFIKEQNGKRVFTPLTQYYQDTLDKGIMAIIDGSLDYNTVLINTVKEMTKSGLRTVDYASGKSFRIESAARTALMTGVNQVAAKISEINAEKLETEHFEVSAHGTARPSHQKWQGKVYTMQELKDICGYGEVDGLCGANCRHSFWAFIVGVSTRNYTDEELEEWANRENTPKKYGDKEYTSYEATQEQRRLERLMRKQRQDIKLLKEGGANEEDITIAEAKYRVTSNEYAKFSKAMQLPEQRARVYGDGLKEVSTSTKSSDIIAQENNRGAVDVEYIGKIDINKLGQFKDKVLTDNVVFTDERKEHTKARHPEDYKKYKKYVPDIIKNPDYILEDTDNDDTVLLLKTILENQKNIQVVVKLLTNFEEKNKSNSILTFFHLRDRSYRSTIKNNQIIYNKLDKIE